MDLVRWPMHAMKTVIMDAFATKQTVGIDHLVTHEWSHIDDMENTDKSWTAMLWMQSTHWHKNNKLRIPPEGYAIDKLINTVRNLWWCTGSLTKETSTSDHDKRPQMHRRSKMVIVQCKRFVRDSTH